MKTGNMKTVSGIVIKKGKSGKEKEVAFDSPADANNVESICFKINVCLHRLGAKKADTTYGKKGYEITDSGFSLVSFF